MATSRTRRADPDAVKPLTRSKHIRLCIYGDPGAGKTDFVGSSPGKVLIIRPPQDHTDSILRPREGLREWVIKDGWSEMNEEVLEYLRMDGHKWDWVWVDSVSILQDVLLDDIWDTVTTEKPDRKRYGLDKGEYGINMLREGIWMRHIIGADQFHFGWTGHPEPLRSSDKDEDGDPIVKLMPYVQGKQMSNKFCGYVNFVGWIEKGKGGKRFLRAAGDEVHYAKDQYDALAGGRLLIPRGKGMPMLLNRIYKARPHMKPSVQARRSRTRRTTRKGR